MANLDALLRIRTDVQGANGIVALNRGLQGVERTAAGASVAMRGLQASVGGVIGLVGGATIMTKIFGDTAALQTQTRSLEVLLGSAAKASQIVKELQAYGSVTPFESTELIETAKRLGAFGIAGQRVVEVTKRLGDVAGATGSNLGELATAYGQVVSKGRLQTEELLQFQERGVGIQAELQKMYGLSGQELQKALSDGRVSSEAFEQAIIRLTDKGGKYANGAIAQSDTLNGRLSTLRDTVTSLSQTIGTVLEPAMSRILLIATNTVETINRAMRAALLGPQNADTIAQVNAGQLPFGTAGVDKLIGEQRRRALQGQAAGALGLVNNDKFIKLLQQQPEFRSPSGAGGRTAPLVVPALTDGTRAAGGGGGGGGGKAPAGRIIEYLTGDRSSAGYRADHGGSNYHDHLAFGSTAQRDAAMKSLRAAGIRIGSVNDGRHAKNSYHYSGQAFDVPGGQVPVGQEAGLSALVRKVLGGAGFVGKGIGKEAGYADDLAGLRAQGENKAAEIAKKAKEDANRKKKEQDENNAKQLVAARETLFTKQAQLKIEEAINPTAKLSAEYDKEKSDRMRDYAARLADAGTEQARQALVAAQIVDIRRAEIGYQEKLRDITAQRIAQEREGADALAESMARMEELTSRGSVGAGFKQGIQGYVESVGTMRDAVGQLATDSIGGLEDSLAELANTGTINFKAFAASVLQDTSRMIIRQLVLKTIMSAIGGIFTPSTAGLGNESARSLGSYAGGGYTGNGSRSGGLDGQGGFMAMLHPRETVIDHTRGTPRVAAAGGNAITINVDASGTKAEGNAGTGAALARDLARVVDDRLIHHRRPGGLLAA
jgi:lambda family phage tail tape measure protein